MNNSNRTICFESIDNSATYKNVEKLFKLMDSIIQKTSEENIAQIITNCAPYNSTCEMLKNKYERILKDLVPHIT